MHGFPLSWVYQVNLPKRVPRSGLTCSPLWMSLSPRLRPVIMQWKLILSICICSFTTQGSWPKSEGQNVDQLLNPKLCFMAQLLFPTTVWNNAHITADATSIRLSISRPIYPTFVSKTPRYLNSFTWGSNSPHKPAIIATNYNGNYYL